MSVESSQSAIKTSSPAGRPGEPRLWGLTAIELHDRRWASLAVETVRPSQRRQVESVGPALYLLLDRDQMALFDLGPIARRMAWLKPALMTIRLRDQRAERYRERVDDDGAGAFVRVSRAYGRRRGGAMRAVLTSDPRLARRWANAETARAAWLELKSAVSRDRIAFWRVGAAVFDASRPGEQEAAAAQLQAEWASPDVVIDGVYEFQQGVWLHETVAMRSGVRFVPPVWVGAGAPIPADALVVGPCRIPDDPRARLRPAEPAWEDVERESRLIGRRSPGSRRPRRGKRAFDVAFSLAVLIATAPIYPIAVAIILIEDGWPPFFAHRRQTLRGREFPCLKFRTMRKDAEKLKAELAKQNQADGPQFFIENDPRLLKSGKWFRRFQIDELPQFLNVLAGHMSVVGPRPSPDKENQYCPAWREARLSVRPGVTGLWQVRRTREPETDFQEWIRYDLEYVRRQGWRLDLWIIVQTVLKMVKG